MGSGGIPCLIKEEARLSLLVRHSKVLGVLEELPGKCGRDG